MAKGLDKKKNVKKKGKTLKEKRAAKKEKKKSFKRDDFRTPTYTNNPKYFGKERIDDSSRDGERKKFNFKKGKKKFKNRSRPKSFKFKKHRRNRPN